MEYEEEYTAEAALKRLFEHTQYCVPYNDDWAFRMAMDALKEKVEREKLE